MIQVRFRKELGFFLQFLFLTKSVILLGAFQNIPAEDKCLVFSGHTHGGQVGLVSLNINLTLLTLTGIPDNGLWQMGQNILYVNRAQGCRTVLGTMLVRMGVPPEYAVMDININKSGSLL
jgi:uncharacterized protein